MKMFLNDLANIMLELGFESEKNTPTMLGGMAMGTLNNDPRFSGADKSVEMIKIDPIKKFPKNAALIFRAITGIVGMLNEQKEDLTNGLTLVQLWNPLYSDSVITVH